MPSVTLDGVRIAYTLSGTGPVLVVPEANVGWAAYGLTGLAERFTVVTVSPRGFMGSGRLAAEDYSAGQISSDIERVLDHLGIGWYALLGYSLNGAVASYLALANPRVQAVACGGFPTTASLAGFAESRRRQLVERQRDPELWAETLAALDPAALMAFFDTVDALSAGELVAGLDCPVWSWWGGDDPLFEPFGGVEAHRAAIERLGLPYLELPGLDHDQALTQSGRLLPDLADWLESVVR